MAARSHENPRTTKPYDRTKERLTQEEVRIPDVRTVGGAVRGCRTGSRGADLAAAAGRLENGRSVDVGLHEELSFGR